MEQLSLFRWPDDFDPPPPRRWRSTRGAKAFCATCWNYAWVADPDGWQRYVVQGIALWACPACQRDPFERRVGSELEQEIRAPQYL
jgi:hypothetical protein